MSDFFSIYVDTPWEDLKTKHLTQIKLLSLKSVLKSFPVIEEEFFDDLRSKVYNLNYYSFVQCIKRIIGPNNEDYDILTWNFIWAFDNENRMFQFLFQKVKDVEKSQAILVALAPPELAKLFSEFKKDAILRTLSILNTPSKIKFLMILGAKGKSIAEEQQLFRFNKDYFNRLKISNVLRNMPNIQGQWFPAHKPRCPLCNGLLAEIQDYKIGFGKLICPQCGYEMKKRN